MDYRRARGVAGVASYGAPFSARQTTWTRCFLRPSLATLVAFAFLTIPHLAQAQIAAGVTAGLSSQDQRNRNTGTTLGGVTFLDAALGDRFSLGGEVSLGASIEGQQTRRTSTGITTLASRHRDTIFSSVSKVTVAQALRAQVAAIVGMGVSWRHTVRHGTFRSFPPLSSAPVDETLSNAVFATTLGLDTMLNFSPRTLLVFTARLHLLKDDDRDGSGVVQRGVGSSIFRFGGGVLIRF
jgi:hypothetical protein